MLEERVDRVTNQSADIDADSENEPGDLSVGHQQDDDAGLSDHILSNFSRDDDELPPLAERHLPSQTELKSLKLPHANY